ncbi:G5 domain-containing protein [Ureibacillus acetophenoni]
MNLIVSKMIWSQLSLLKKKSQSVRVEKVTDVVEETVAFAVETKSDSSLLKGQEKVVTQGEEGIVLRMSNKRKRKRSS